MQRDESEVPSDESVALWLEHRIGNATTAAEAAARVGLKQEATRALMRRFGVPFLHEKERIMTCAKFTASVRQLSRAAGLPYDLVRNYTSRKGIAHSGRVETGRPSGYNEQLVRQTVPLCYTWGHAADIMKVSISTAKRWAATAGVTLAVGGQR